MFLSGLYLGITILIRCEKCGTIKAFPMNKITKKKEKKAA